MESPSHPPTGELALVLQRLTSLEQRVAGLERGKVQPIQAEPPTPSIDAETEAPIFASSDWLPLLGRTLLVLGGAFVLRAITEANLVPATVGTLLGIVYALAWLFLADREAGRDRTASATWHAVATCIVAFPLLWEASTRFGFLGPVSTAAAVLGVTLLALFVAWRRSSGSLAWLASVSALGTLVILAVSKGPLELFVGCLLLLGLATWWLGYTRHFHGPARLAALAAFASILLLTLIQVVVEPERRAAMLDGRVTLGLQLALVVIYVGSSIARTLARRRALRSEEIAVGLAAAVIGLGGAVAVSGVAGTGLVWLGLVTAILAAAGYWAAFALVDQAEPRTNFLYFSSLALVFTLMAFAELLNAPWLSIVFAAATVLMAMIGTRWGRATLSVHGSVYAIAGAFASGLWFLGAVAFGVPGTGSHANPTPAIFAVLVGALVYCAFPVATHERTWGALARLPKFLVLVVATVGLGGVVTSYAARLLPLAEGGPGADPGALAVLRTAVLALSAVALARLGRHPPVEQCAWLVYPVLVLGGLKLLIEDLQVGSPLVLVASFLLYGSALILAPRWSR